MGRRPSILPDRALTGAEREARRRKLKAERDEARLDAIRRAIAAETIADARAILAAVMPDKDTP